MVDKLESFLISTGIFFIFVALSSYFYFWGGLFVWISVLLMTFIALPLFFIMMFSKYLFSEIKFHWLFVLLTPFIIFNFIGAMSPVTDADGAGYHLAIPKIYLQEGRFVYHLNVVSNWPMSGEMLYVPLMAAHWPPKLIHFLFGILLTLLIYCIAKRFFNHEIAAWASVITYTIPLIVLESGIAYVDLFFSFYIVLGLYLAYRAFDIDSKWLFILSSVFIGFGASIKWHGPIFVALAFIFISGKSIINNGLKRGIKNVWWYPLPGSAFCSMWYIKNWILSGSPFIPFTTGLNWTAQNVTAYLSSIKAPALNALVNIFLPFWDLTVTPLKFGELTWIGPVFLAFISIPLLTKMFMEKRKIETPIFLILTFSFLFYIVWMLLMPQSRLLLPILVLLSIVIAWVIKGNKVYQIAVLISIVSAIPFALLYNGQILYKPNLLEEKIPAYPVYMWANHNLKNAAVLVYGDIHTYYLDVPYLWARPDMQGMISNYKDLTKYGINYVIIDHDKKGEFPEIYRDIMSNNLSLLFGQVYYTIEGRNGTILAVPNSIGLYEVQHKKETFAKAEPWLNTGCD